MDRRAQGASSPGCPSQDAHLPIRLGAPLCLIECDVRARIRAAVDAVIATIVADSIAAGALDHLPGDTVDGGAGGGGLNDSDDELCIAEHV